MAKTQLLSLPAELLENVAEQTDGQDLKALRFTCREVHAATDRTFIKTFFTNRTHLVTKYSLETLVSITASPRLRSQLKSLVFVRGSLEVMKGDRRIVISGVNRRDRMEVSPSPIALLEHALHKKWSEVDMELHGKRQIARKLMAAALKNLKGHGILPSLAVSQTCNGTPFGRSQLGVLLGLDSEAVWMPWSTSASDNTTTLLKAIARAGFPAQELHLAEASFATAFGRCVRRNSTLIPDLHNAFKTIVTLHLNTVKAFSWTVEVQNAFKQLIGSCDALKHLSVDHLVFWEETDPTARSISAAFSSKRLRSIKLDNGVAGVEEIMELLEPHKMTLEVLELRSILCEHGAVSGWSPLFARLATSLTLREVHIENLHEIEANMEGSAILKGTQEVREGLESLAGRRDLFVPVDPIE